MTSAALNTIDYQDLATARGEDRETLILRHLPRVRWVATRIHEKLPHSTDLEDLISVGIIGLIAAIDNFDPTLNVQLKTYAELKIRGAILDSIRGMDGVAPHHRAKIKQIQKAIVEVAQRVKRAPCEEEIATELGISVGTYWEWLEHVRGVSLSNLDGLAGEDGPGQGMLQFIADRSDPGPEALLQKSELEELIQAEVEKLPQPEQVVLDLYYSQELNLREIGQVMGLHLTRISQLKSQAILRIQSSLKMVLQERKR